MSSLEKCLFRSIWRRQWLPTPVLSPGQSHGWRSLVGCSPWGPKESDTTEWLHFHFSLPCIGEGNGNPLQCSCLENPRDGGAWWAAVYGVAQSRTRMKWLSSSSSRSAYFFNQIFFFFLLLSCLNSLYILHINSLLDIWFADVFCHSAGRLFILLMVPFTVRKPFSLM